MHCFLEFLFCQSEAGTARLCSTHTVSCVTGQEPRAWRTQVFYDQWRACLTFTRERSSVFIALDSTHTCPLLQREAPSLIPKAAGCTNNPWKGNPDKSSQSFCLQDLQKLDTRREQLPDIHSSKRLQSSKRDLLAVSQLSKAFTMCWNFLSVLSPTVTADISAPYFQQKKTNKVALEHIFNKFIKKRLINLGKKEKKQWIHFALSMRMERRILLKTEIQVTNEKFELWIVYSFNKSNFE